MIGPIVAGGDAASAQENSAQLASQTEMNMFNQEQGNLQPYMATGIAANSALNGLTGLGSGNPLASSLLAAPNMTESTLQSTPGYQFNLAQGLKATQNSAASRGLGVSGAAMKGAATYATGLADSTYQNQYNNAVTNQTNQFNRLMGLTQLGQNSAAGVGAAGVQTGANIASNTIGAGNAAAANDISMGNAGSNALSSAYMANNLSGGGLFSSGPSSGGYVPAQSQLSSEVGEDIADE